MALSPYCRGQPPSRSCHAALAAFGAGLNRTGFMARIYHAVPELWDRQIVRPVPESRRPLFGVRRGILAPPGRRFPRLRRDPGGRSYDGPGGARGRDELRAADVARFPDLAAADGLQRAGASAAYQGSDRGGAMAAWNARLCGVQIAASAGVRSQVPLGLASITGGPRR